MKLSRSAPSHIMNHELVLNSIETKFIEKPERMGEMNQHMFREDFGNIFIGLNRRNSNVFVINSNNDEIREEILNSFIRAADYSHDESVFQEVLEEIIQNLLHFGKAAYFLHNSKSGEQVFRSLLPSTIFNAFSILFQYLPRRIKHNWDHDDEQLGREVRFLNPNQVLFFEWPKPVQKKIKAQNRILEILDEYTYAGASQQVPLPTHKNPNPKNYFDFSVWHKTREEALFEATRHTGWSGRETSSSKSDFFICHRMLRFSRLQVETCTHLLEELSKQLTVIGKSIKPDFKIQISFSPEFPSLSKFDELEKGLRNEEVDFSEVLDFCFQKE